VEARSAKLFAAGGVAPVKSDTTGVEKTNLHDNYVKRLGELVRFDVLAKAKTKFAVDALHGCGAGYLNKVLADHGVPVETIRADRDVLFDGTGPDVSEENLAPLRDVVLSAKATAGLATDGDADRFGVLDETGAYVQPNEILALLLQDFLGRKGRRGGVARSVATTHALDALAARYGVPLHETPVGFKYIGELLLEKKIIFGGEESAGLTVEGHVPEKDGILADLLTAEMAGATGKTIGALRSELWKEIGPFLTRRIDLDLSAEARAKLATYRKTPPSSVAGRRVANVNLLDGIKLIFEDGSWILVRESGTEPVARVYIEAKTESDLDALARAGRELIA